MGVKPDRLGGTHDVRLSLVSMQANCTIKLTHAYFFHLLLTARFLNTGLSASHCSAVWLPTIGARQPSKFTFCSLLTAAYPTWERSVHDEG